MRPARAGRSPPTPFSAPASSPAGRRPGGCPGDRTRDRPPGRGGRRPRRARDPEGEPPDRQGQGDDFLRAPFTRYQAPAGHGELEEAPRGRGMQYAIGELLVCPYCLAQWVAGGFAVGHVFAPRTTRLLSAMWAAQAIADGVQLAYSAGEQQT